LVNLKSSRLGWPLWNICVTNDLGYAPFVVNTSGSFPHSLLITVFVTRLTRRIPLVGAPEFTPCFYWGSCNSIFSFMCNVLKIVVCPFSFGHCVVCSSSINGFWLPPFGIFKLFCDYLYDINTYMLLTFCEYEPI